MKRIRRAAVIGAGSMGHGVAQLFAQAGIAVRITDTQPDHLTAGLCRVRQNLKAFIKAGILKQGEADATFSLIEPVETIGAAVRDATFVTECVTESLQIKRMVFEELDAHALPSAILASNTSSISLAEIATNVKHKSRLIVTHYFNPPQIIPIVEIVPSKFTDPSVTEETYTLLVRMRKLPVCLRKELPGFLVNRIQCAVVREALSMLEQGVASAEEIDSAIRGTLGLRLAALGPLAIMDFGGLDVWLEVVRNVFPSLSNGTEPPQILNRKVERGYLGVKSAQGFYDWGLGSGLSLSAKVLRRRDEAYLSLLKLLYKR